MVTKLTSSSFFYQFVLFVDGAECHLKSLGATGSKTVCEWE